MTFGCTGRQEPALVRARYSAYVEKDVTFLAGSLAPDARKDFEEKAARDWAERSTFERLSQAHPMAADVLQQPLQDRVSWSACAS
jgi:uncharacterized protein YchJ